MTHATAPTITLRDYQQDCLTAIATTYGKQGQNRILVQLATGLGKTSIGAALIGDWLATTGPSVLWIAHREELIDQAAERIRLMNPGATVSVEQGDRYANPYSDVVVASIQTLSAIKQRRLTRLLHRTRFRLVVIDEAHHASAASYRNVLVTLKFLPPADASDSENTDAADFEDVAEMEQALRGWDAQAPQDQLLVGVTATPNRSDAIGLGCVFQTIAYAYGIKPAIETGWLCPIVPLAIETATSLDDVRTTHGEFNQKDLAEAVNHEARNALAVAAWQEHAAGLPTIAFTVDVAHAYAMARTFQEAGVTAVAVSGETPKEERAQAFADFRAGRVTVLANCMIVTEGVDLPHTACIVNAKPTKSATLYTQMVGRGLRPLPGKPHCVVIDLVDVARKHSLQAAPVLYGLPPGIKADGRDLRDLATDLEAIKEQYPHFDVDAALATGRLTLAQLGAQAKRVDIWTVPELGEIAKHVKLNWIRSGDDLYRLQYPKNDYETETLVVQRNLLGQFEVVRTVREKVVPRNTPRRVTQSTLATSLPSAAAALSTAEAYIANERGSSVMKMKQRDAPWRQRPASQGQRDFLTKLRIPFNRQSLTSGQASDMIDMHLAKRGR